MPHENGATGCGENWETRGVWLTKRAQDSSKRIIRRPVLSDSRRVGDVGIGPVWNRLRRTAKNYIPAWQLSNTFTLRPVVRTSAVENR